MNILTSSNTLDPAGVPTYTLTMVNALTVGHGHTVAVYSPLGGSLAQRFPLVITDPHTFKPDVIIAQHTPCAVTLKSAHPDVPFIYSAHGTVPDIEQPPPVDMVDWWTAINDIVRRNLIKYGVPPGRISIVRDFIDTQSFKPFNQIQETDKPRVLFISNYKKWKNYKMLKAACDRLGYPLKAVGSPYGRSKNIIDDINDADIVVTWGRGILEGMSCGRAVISYDKEEGDGYLTTESYFEAREHNFGVSELRYRFTVDTLVDELRKYNPADGRKNRNLILRYHNVSDGVISILEAVEYANEAKGKPWQRIV